MPTNTNKPPLFTPLAFVLEVREELKKVTWPSQKEAIRLTTIVIVASLAVGAYIAGLDYLFTQITNLIIKR